jgi:hypothetical protein
VTRACALVDAQALTVGMHDSGAAASPSRATSTYSLRRTDGHEDNASARGAPSRTGSSAPSVRHPLCSQRSCRGTDDQGVRTSDCRSDGTRTARPESVRSVTPTTVGAPSLPCVAEPTECRNRRTRTLQSIPSSRHLGGPSPRSASATARGSDGLRCSGQADQQHGPTSRSSSWRLALTRRIHTGSTCVKVNTTHAVMNDKHASQCGRTQRAK